MARPSELGIRFSFRHRVGRVNRSGEDRRASWILTKPGQPRDIEVELSGWPHIARVDEWARRRWVTRRGLRALDLAAPGVFPQFRTQHVNLWSGLRNLFGRVLCLCSGAREPVAQQREAAKVRECASDPVPEESLVVGGQQPMNLDSFAELPECFPISSRLPPSPPSFNKNCVPSLAPTLGSGRLGPLSYDRLRESRKRHGYHRQDS